MDMDTNEEENRAQEVQEDEATSSSPAVTDQATAGDVATQATQAAVSPPGTPPPRYSFGLEAITNSGAFRALLAIQNQQGASIRPPLPRTVQSGANRPSFPRTAQTTSNIPPNPRISMTSPSALLDEWMRTMPERERAELNRRIEQVLSRLPTFAINSDPAASATHTTYALRKERLAEDCAITRSPITRPCETVCGHIFQAEAMARSWLRDRLCPICRTLLIVSPSHTQSSDMHLLEGELKVDGAEETENAVSDDVVGDESQSVQKDTADPNDDEPIDGNASKEMGGR